MEVKPTKIIVMKYENIPVENITVPKHCIKQKEPEKLRRLKKVIQKRGQTLPVQVREIKDDRYEVITGRKVYQCLKELEVDKVYCVNHGRLSDEEAKLICLETSLQDYESDTIGQAELIEEVVACYGKEEVLKTLPMTVNELNGYLDYLHFDWNGETGQRKKKKPAAEITPAVRPELDIRGLLRGIYNV
jgi:hypothetical protein